MVSVNVRGWQLQGASPFQPAETGTDPRPAPSPECDHQQQTDQAEQWNIVCVYLPWLMEITELESVGYLHY